MLLLGPGIDYTKLNFIHRWAGRFLFLGALVHGTLWNNHVIYDLPILSQQKEGSGVAALSVLCVLVLTSAAPLRRWCYSAFLVCHFLTFPAFFITICYHTIYAMPWIVPPVAFYAADLLLRILRWRVVVGRVEAKGTAGMSLIHVPLAARGWRAGQHVQVRAIIGARAWESHPLSICCAPPGESCLTGPDGAPLGMLLGARACGDWSRALHAFGLQEDADVLDEEETSTAGEKSASNAIAATPEAHDRKMQETRAPETAAEELRGRDAHFVLEGPYGGPTLNADEYESVLLFAGGSGATFTLGVLDALVARCVPLAPAASASSPAPKTTRVVWCWCVRSFNTGAINWFAPYLLQIATRAARPDSALDLRMRIFVTCLCNPDAVPRIPGCTVTEMRPAVWRVLAGMLDPACADEYDGEGGPKGRGSSATSSASASVDALPLSVPAADAEKGIRAGHGDARARRAPTGGVAVFVPRGGERSRGGEPERTGEARGRGRVLRRSVHDTSPPWAVYAVNELFMLYGAEWAKAWATLVACQLSSECRKSGTGPGATKLSTENFLSTLARSIAVRRASFGSEGPGETAETAEVVADSGKWESDGGKRSDRGRQRRQRRWWRRATVGSARAGGKRLWWAAQCVRGGRRAVGLALRVQAASGALQLLREVRADGVWPAGIAGGGGSRAVLPPSKHGKGGEGRQRVRLRVWVCSAAGLVTELTDMPVWVCGTSRKLGDAPLATSPLGLPVHTSRHLGAAHVQLCCGTLGASKLADRWPTADFRAAERLVKRRSLVLTYSPRRRRRLHHPPTFVYLPLAMPSRSRCPAALPSPLDLSPITLAGSANDPEMTFTHRMRSRERAVGWGRMRFIMVFPTESVRYALRQVSSASKQPVLNSIWAFFFSLKPPVEPPPLQHPRKYARTTDPPVDTQQQNLHLPDIRLGMQYPQTTQFVSCCPYTCQLELSLGAYGI
ncbi:hypothetical protein GGX14DRAFT_661928 [Mycena pura]|uniref:FAD-binding FR-type domain-containing protein n=1 Tax=Mycena pura TaxID=153505 RepID=A0AAD6V105_9AGAR|nr:hypothetical protein GGX14DRAFT_661928 [Mycena pura]